MLRKLTESLTGCRIHAAQGVRGRGRICDWHARSNDCWLAWQAKCARCGTAVPVHIVHAGSQVTRVAEMCQRADHLVARARVLDRQHVRCRPNRQQCQKTDDCACNLATSGRNWSLRLPHVGSYSSRCNSLHWQWGIVLVSSFNVRPCAPPGKRTLEAVDGGQDVLEVGVA